MRLSEARDLLDARCEFPIEHDRLTSEVGDELIEAPTGGSVSVATALGRTGETTYRSATEAHLALVGNLDARHVGRRGYDDRSPTVYRAGEVSF